MTTLGVSLVELMPDWVHPSPQIIFKFGGDTASLPSEISVLGNSISLCPQALRQSGRCLLYPQNNLHFLK